MNESDRKARIHQLQNRRHALLQKLDTRGAPTASIDMELNVVRSELQALYEVGPMQPLHPADSEATTLQTA